MAETTILWLAWEKHTRNQSLSRQLGATLVQLDYPTKSRAARYGISVLQTLKWLWRWRNSTVIVQNPSLILTLIAVALRPLLRYQLAVDAHNAGIFPQEGTAPVLQRIANWVIRHTPYTLVTNRGLAEVITQLGGSPLVVPDPLPHLEQPTHSHSEPNSLVFICSWAADEPYLDVFNAAAALPHITFYVTGNAKGREKAYGKPLPTNIQLTGYLSETDFVQRLASSAVILDLTTREHCLVCGAYEAVECEKPFVLSATQATKAYFYKGGEYANNTAEGIRAAIERAFANLAQHQADVKDLKQELIVSWQSHLQTLQTQLNSPKKRPTV
jgi:hypothetical protein